MTLNQSLKDVALDVGAADLKAVAELLLRNLSQFTHIDADYRLALEIISKYHPNSRVRKEYSEKYSEF